MPTNGVCAEIGVFKGDFSEKILHINRPHRLYLIDPFVSWQSRGPGLKDMDANTGYAEVCARFADAIAGGTAELVREPSEIAVSRINDASLDWIYIDGDHHFDFVRRDLELYYPKIKPGGYIVCDDYHYPGNWDDGVTRAVDEFMKRGSCRKIFKRRSQLVMRKIKA
jgi:hypothetical protein